MGRIRRQRPRPTRSLLGVLLAALLAGAGAAGGFLGGFLAGLLRRRTPTSYVREDFAPPAER
jgi:hypothetical protein